MDTAPRDTGWRLASALAPTHPPPTSTQPRRAAGRRAVARPGQGGPCSGSQPHRAEAIMSATWDAARPPAQAGLAASRAPPPRLSANRPRLRAVPLQWRQHRSSWGRTGTWPWPSVWLSASTSRGNQSTSPSTQHVTVSKAGQQPRQAGNPRQVQAQHILLHTSGPLASLSR